MSRTTILDPNRSYTFRSYFEMPLEPEDILAEFGCSLERSFLELPHTSAQLDRLADLKSRIEESLPHISLSKEEARREFLISPILLDLVCYTHANLRIEYPLHVNHRLKGSLDYYLHNNRQLLIVEAKNADLSRGFTQLAVELIALDSWTDTDEIILTGAVSTGDIWQFGQFDRQERKISQDLNLYRIPADVSPLLRILVALIHP